MQKKIFLIFFTFFTLIASAQSIPSKQLVLEKMKLANSYFTNKWPDPTAAIVTDKTRPSNLWTRGTYYEGLMQLYYLTQDATLLKYAVDWGTFHQWQPTYTGTVATRIADNQCCGQTYLELYQLDPTKTERKATMQTSIEAMVNSTKSNDWWWVDALHMAMPVFAKFGVIYNDNKYFNEMYALYHFSRYRVKNGTGLYNSIDHLWYRDSTYLPPTKSSNNLPVYWSRGNGWVFAALVRVLDIMPENAPHRDEYLTMFKDMASKLITIQREDGFWNPNLGDANDYGGKETSGTVFFTYGLAWGIRKGFLDANIYLTPAIKAWNGLVNDALHTDGALGYVQSSGSKPADGQPLSYDKMSNFEDFGLGGFLLAGSEMYRLSEKIEKTAATEISIYQPVQAYPNPFTEKTGIVFKAPTKIEKLQISDANGRIIFSKNNVNNNIFEWKAENLPVGIYYVELLYKTKKISLSILKRD